MITAIAIAAVVLIAATTLVWQGRQIRDLNRRADNREREWARERRDLLNRVMHLSGRSWEPPEYPMVSEEIADEIGILFPEEQPLE